MQKLFAGMDKGREERPSNPVSPSVRYRVIQRCTHSRDMPIDSAIRACDHPF